MREREEVAVKLNWLMDTLLGISIEMKLKIESLKIINLNGRSCEGEEGSSW